MEVDIIKDTKVQGKKVRVGERIEVSKADGAMLLNLRRATLPAAAPEPEPAPAPEPENADAAQAVDVDAEPAATASRKKGRK